MKNDINDILLDYKTLESVFGSVFIFDIYFYFYLHIKGFSRIISHGKKAPACLGAFFFIF
jgi:hypothetical protein